jgi:hypothetical protein
LALLLSSDDPSKFTLRDARRRRWRRVKRVFGTTSSHTHPLPNFQTAEHSKNPLPATIPDF